MALDQKDLELIERMIYKNNDDVAVSVSRSFERLEERIDASESRLYFRLTEIQDQIEAARQDATDQAGDIREEIRDYIRHKEEMEMA